MVQIITLEILRSQTNVQTCARTEKGKLIIVFQAQKYCVSYKVI